MTFFGDAHAPWLKIGIMDSQIECREVMDWENFMLHVFGYFLILLITILILLLLYFYLFVYFRRKKKNFNKYKIYIKGGKFGHYHSLSFTFLSSGDFGNCHAKSPAVKWMSFSSTRFFQIAVSCFTFQLWRRVFWEVFF